jgi:CxC5 like cysteine cluster associated with KDZ transposases
MDGPVALVSHETQLCNIKINECEAAHTVYPPTDVCTDQGCSNKNPLKKETLRRVLVYTVAHGVQPAWAVHVYCTRMYLFIS